MRRLYACAALAASMLFGGCSHLNKLADNNKASYGAYAVQARSFEAVKLEFASGVGQAGGAVTITGLTAMTLAMPLTPLDKPPVDRGFMGEIKDAAVGIAPYGMGAYLGGKALDSSGSTTVNNAAAAEAASP